MEWVKRKCWVGEVGEVGEEQAGVLIPLPSRQQPHYLDVVSCVQGRGEAEHRGQKHLGKRAN